MNLLFVMVGTTALRNPDVGRAPDHRDNRLLQGDLERYFRSPRQQAERWPALLKDLVEAHWRYWDSDPAYCFCKKNWKETSAELTSTQSLIRDLRERQAKLPEKIVLLASDTDEGEMAALINEAVLKRLHPGVAVGFKRVENLEVKFSDLTHSIEGIVNDERESGADRVVFNITGGYKGAIPSIAYLASGGSWKLYYQHETSAEGVYLDFMDGRLHMDTKPRGRSWE